MKTKGLRRGERKVGERGHTEMRCYKAMGRGRCWFCVVEGRDGRLTLWSGGLPGEMRGGESIRRMGVESEGLVRVINEQVEAERGEMEAGEKAREMKEKRSLELAVA